MVVAGIFVAAAKVTAAVLLDRFAAAADDPVEIPVANVTTQVGIPPKKLWVAVVAVNVRVVPEAVAGKVVVPQPDEYVGVARVAKLTTSSRTAMIVSPAARGKGEVQPILKALATPATGVAMVKLVLESVAMVMAGEAAIA